MRRWIAFLLVVALVTLALPTWVLAGVYDPPPPRATGVYDPPPPRSTGVYDPPPPRPILMAVPDFVEAPGLKR